MVITRPYRRTCRPFRNSDYATDGRWRYIEHPKFAQTPEHYVRAFLLLLKDLQGLFDYVEPADTNLKCYSYRIHALLLRACIEVGRLHEDQQNAPACFVSRQGAALDRN